MPGPIVINYFNFSSIELTQSSGYTDYTMEEGIDSLEISPTSTLPAAGGKTTMEMSEDFLSNLGGGLAFISLGWFNPATNNHTGAKIVLPIQVLDMGDRPYYQVSSGTSSTPDWQTPVSDPADPYTYPKVEFEAQLTADSTHTALTISITIS